MTKHSSELTGVICCSVICGIAGLILLVTGAILKETAFTVAGGAIFLIFLVITVMRGSKRHQEMGNRSTRTQDYRNDEVGFYGYGGHTQLWDSGDAAKCDIEGTDSGGCDLGGANTGGAESGGCDSRGADTGGCDSGGGDTGGCDSGGGDSGCCDSGGGDGGCCD